MDVDVVMVVEGILDTMELMVIILPIKGKLQCTTRKWNNTEAKQDEKHAQNTPFKIHENTCHRCGMKGHWSRTCRTTKHLVDLYQASMKKIEKNIELNFTDAKRLDLSYYDVDFFGAPLEKTNYLMDD